MSLLFALRPDAFPSVGGATARIVSRHGGAWVGTVASRIPGTDDFAEADIYRCACTNCPDCGSGFDVFGNPCGECGATGELEPIDDCPDCGGCGRVVD